MMRGKGSRANVKNKKGKNKMKKIMIAVAAICAAVMAQAAVANWKVSAANIYDGTDASKYSGAAYFFDASAMSQEALFALFEADTSLDLTKQTGYLATGTVSSGSISSSVAANQFSVFEQGSGAHDFFFVLVNDDAIFLSNTKAGVNAGGNDSPVSITFGTQASTTAAYNSKMTTEGFVSAGTWAVVPEPTTGLLMLVGLAGLALRRRRA
jgi:hypothetical protein